ncbi:hypothetical protein PVAP13_5NG586650 [Panicum virgatum]|uniref:Uncharacterized protein n=1 Tax=Panicum virgatum TaxID=38727 RepID=A0A8T0S6V9_PANVG|nr:hypothetical protein PVAP13_5NG586650 [Panicum virgatum]
MLEVRSAALPRGAVGLGGFDLNSGADDFPDFDRYAQILRPEDGFVHGLPPIRPGSRSSGLRGKTGRKARGGGSAGASGSRSQNNGAGSSRSMRGSSLPDLLSAQQSLAVLEEVAGRPPWATAAISLPAFSPPCVTPGTPLPAVASACHPVLHFPEVEAVERPEVEVVAASVHHHPQQMQATPTMMKTSRTKMSVDLMERTSLTRLDGQNKIHLYYMK